MPIPPPPTFATPSRPPNGQSPNAANGQSSAAPPPNNYNIPLNHLRQAPTDASDPASHASRAAELLARSRNPAAGSNRNASNASASSSSTAKTSAHFAQLSADLNARGAKETESVTGVDGLQEIDAALGEGARRRGRDDDLEEGSSRPATTAEKPVNKPVHLPSGSRKTIIVNACQVSHTRRSRDVKLRDTFASEETRSSKRSGMSDGSTAILYPTTKSVPIHACFTSRKRRKASTFTCLTLRTALARLKYHRLHPEYLHSRIERLKGMYLLRILLIICDVVRSLVSVSANQGSCC